MMTQIPPRSGVAFRLARGDLLAVIDPQGQQVADIVAFSAEDTAEHLSSGRSLDYGGKIYLTTGDKLYSNRSTVLLSIEQDDVGRHDFLLAPCSREMFQILYGHDQPHQGCFGNLASALAPFGISPDAIPTAFNCFMNVPVNGDDGTLCVQPPLSKAGDRIAFRAGCDLIIGLTACSAPLSNNGAFKPIHYHITSV